MNKLISIALAGTMLVGLAACSQEAATNDAMNVDEAMMANDMAMGSNDMAMSANPMVGGTWPNNLKLWR